MDVKQLKTALQRGDKRALAKLITRLENAVEIPKAMKALFADLSWSCYCIGITGPPGVGKSTLINTLLSLLRKQGDRVAVLATDPTSPFSGGAILGDRIRMVEHSSDQGVFIRSLGSRGNPDGLSTALPYILKTLDLYGMDYCLIETVGSGQLDVLIKAFADSTILVLSPEAGDDIQVMKAGILEVADIMVINKSDRKGVDHLANQLQVWIDLLPKNITWHPPIIKTEANRNRGTEAVLQALRNHRTHLESLRKTIRDNDVHDHELEHLKFLVLNLAAALFRRQSLNIMEGDRLNKLLKQQPVNIVKLATEVINAFKESHNQ